MIKLKIPLIVEGKYDKARLSGVVDAVIIPTNGFRVFRDEEKRALIRRLGQNGIVLLCDSDGGGRQIRSKLRGMLGGIPVYDLYTPQIEGKERRKAAPSAAGYLGVEGVPNEILREIFAAFAKAHPELAGESDGAGEAGETPSRKPVTKSQMYELGLTGTANAAENRAALCRKLGLPADMNANGLLAALNLLTDAEELERLARGQ